MTVLLEQHHICKEGNNERGSMITPTPVNRREQLWDDFLIQWPIERIAQMSLSDYTDVNRKVTFAYWLEFATHDLGSMRGGGAFKFGIYCRKGPIKEQRAHFSHDGTYSWLSLIHI